MHTLGSRRSVSGVSSPRSRTAVCPVPGCPTLTAGGRCPAHGKPDRRPNASQRGYGARWQKIRSAFLAAHPLCAGVDGEHHPHCDGQATVPDHAPLTRRELVARGVADPDAWEYLVPLSTACHGWKTVRYDGGWGRERQSRDPGGPPSVVGPSVTRTCAWCGVEFRASVGSTRSFCTLACGGRLRSRRSEPVPWRQCGWCAEFFVSRRQRAHCSEDCASAFRTWMARSAPRPVRPPPPDRERVCRKCGVVFTAGPRRLRCDACRDLAALERRRREHRNRERRLRERRRQERAPGVAYPRGA